MNIKKRTAVIASIVLLAVGFLLGRLTFTERASEQTREVVKYVKSSIVLRDTITQQKLIPYETFVADTVYQYLTTVVEVDTAAILKDYYLSRRYNLDFSDDTVGTFLVDAEVNQNRLVYASSTIQPITKTVYTENTVYRSPTIQFYGMLGTSVNLKTNKLSFGVDLKQRYLLGVSGIRFDDNYNYTIDFGIKF
jgi:hypothetical protein